MGAEYHRTSVMPRIVCTLFGNLLQWLALAHAFGRENLFLRKQLAFYVERRIKPRRLDDVTRLAMVVLARLIK